MSAEPENITKGHQKGRRDFISYLAWMLLAPLAVLIFRLSGRTRETGSGSVERRIKISQLTREASFMEGLAITMPDKSTGLRVFSARCSHLGCLINQYQDGLMICPCHGSTYDLYGKVVKGPGNRPLKELEYKLDPASGEIVINT